MQRKKGQREAKVRIVMSAPAEMKARISHEHSKREQQDTRAHLCLIALAQDDTPGQKIGGRRIESAHLLLLLIVDSSAHGTTY